MNEDVKKKWIKALRSGKYKQTKGKLKSKYNSFCCLGVLCDLHSKTFRTKWDGLINGQIKYLGCGVRLPDEVAQWAGLKHNNPEVQVSPNFFPKRKLKEWSLSFKSDKQRMTLAACNDEINMNFKKIAKIIETEL